MALPPYKISDEPLVIGLCKTRIPSNNKFYFRVVSQHLIFPRWPRNRVVITVIPLYRLKTRRFAITFRAPALPPRLVHLLPNPWYPTLVEHEEKTGFSKDCSAVFEVHGAGCGVVPSVAKVESPPANIASEFGEVGPEDLGFSLGHGSACRQSKFGGIRHRRCTFHHALINACGIRPIDDNEMRGRLSGRCEEGEEWQGLL